MKVILRRNVLSIIFLSLGVTTAILLVSFILLTPNQYNTLETGISIFAVGVSIVLWAYGRARKGKPR